MTSAAASDPTPVATDEAAVDDINQRDLDVETFPLPRLARAIALVWLVRVVVVVVAVSLVLGAFAIGGPGTAVVVAVWPALWLLILLVAVLAGGSDETGLLRLEREAHPHFFALVDDVCARLAVTPPRSFFLINESNAYNAVVGRESSILLGFPSVMNYDVVALRSTLGHELGHHLAGDSADDVQVAWCQLQALALLPVALFPFAPLTRRCVKAAEADALRRSRLNEHAADFWGGVAAGPGTTASCLLKDRRASHLWSAVVDDVVVLREAGLRPVDLYRIVASARRQADDDGFEMLPSLRPTDPTSTHPGEAARIIATEERLQTLPSVATDDGRAIDLFEAREAIARDLTALFYDPQGRGDGDWLTVVPNDSLWGWYAFALRPQLRGAFLAAGHPRLAEPMSAAALFHEVRLLVEAGVRFVVDPRDAALPGVLVPIESLANGVTPETVDVTGRIMGLLLDQLVEDGCLQGNRVFGVVRAVVLAEVECFRLVLAARLANGERWDDVADEVERVAARRRELEAWVRTGFGPCLIPGHPHTAVAPATLRDTPWERDTEENVVPGHPAAAAAVADNSDRERSRSGEGVVDVDEAPAA